MILYQVTDYLEHDAWFGDFASADEDFEKVMYERPQEKSNFLCIRKYSIPLTPTEILLHVLNKSVKWISRSEIVKQANPTVDLS